MSDEEADGLLLEARESRRKRTEHSDEPLILLFCTGCFMQVSFISTLCKAEMIATYEMSRGAQSTLLTRLIYCLLARVCVCVWELNIIVFVSFVYGGVCSRIT